MQADRCLQIRTIQRLAQHATELAVHANVHVGFHQLRHLSQMTAQRKHHVDVCAYALHHATDFGQIAGTVESAVARPDDVDTWLLAFFAHALRHFFHAVLGPQPEHGAVSTLPLVFVNRARQKTHQVGALGCDTAADHFGNRTSHHHSR